MGREFKDANMSDVGFNNGAIFICLAETALDYASLLILEPLGPAHITRARYDHDAGRRGGDATEGERGEGSEAAAGAVELGNQFDLDAFSHRRTDVGGFCGGSSIFDAGPVVQEHVGDEGKEGGYENGEANR